ncbi:hypothetical protein TNCV_3427371 [Trichonephila clavipes]|nr:hypothetical protein TNCV_3427371 [Trichonephila clavipes]
MAKNFPFPSFPPQGSLSGEYGRPRPRGTRVNFEKKKKKPKKIFAWRDGQVLNTKHLILTFSTPDLPQTVKMAYIRCPVRPYIPNPLRCFQCQRYGHSKNVCRGQPTCPRCGESGHDSADCKKKEQCLNCKGDHPAYSRSCPTWITEKEITAVKIKEKFPTQRHGVLFCHARRSLDPKKLSRDFHRKIDEDTLTGDCSEDDEDLMDIQSGPSTSSSRGGASATHMTSFISWNCRGLRTRLDDLKSIISTYQPACVALQETFLKSTMTMQVRGYNCVRRDVDGDTSPTGGVCLFTSNLYPSNVVTLHTSLQAVAVRIHIHSLVTVCCVYLPPNDVVPQVDLNHLVSQLPAPFILLGDFNGHSPLWGHDDTNSLVGDRSNS